MPTNRGDHALKVVDPGKAISTFISVHTAYQKFLAASFSQTPSSPLVIANIEVHQLKAG